MIGSICGDIIGSRFEFNNISNEDFGDLFTSKSVYTDDTVLSVATANAILDESGDYSGQYLAYAQSYPNRGYGGNFAQMIKQGKLEPYDSYGNGAAMRVSPVGWIHPDIESTLASAKATAECSHSHEEGIKGAQAIASAIYWARCGSGKDDIMKHVEEFGYDLSKKVADFRQGQFDVTCQGTIPRCMAILNETDSFESAIRKTIVLGGDTDTNGAIVGGMCDGLYGLPKREIIEAVYARIPKQMASVITRFTKKYIDKDFIEPENIATIASTAADALSAIF